MAPKRGSKLLGGLALIGMGLWLLADNLGFDLPGMGALWPIFPTLGGLALIYNYFTDREKDAGVLVPGVGGFLVGLFFLVITLGPLSWGDLDQWWPIFPLIFAVAFIATFVFSKQHDAGLLVPGIGGLLVGIFFLLITLGPLRWREMDVLWPAFPLIAGVTFFSVWLANRKDRGLLIPAGLGVAVGLVGFVFTLRILQVRLVERGWPVLLIVIGLALVLKSLIQGRPDQDQDQDQ